MINNIEEVFKALIKMIISNPIVTILVGTPIISAIIIKGNKKGL